MPETIKLQELTYLSKTNITQTILLLKEAQSYWQEQRAKELFEEETEIDFLELSKDAYKTNYILNDFANALKENTLDAKIGLFNKMQDIYNFADIYDAVEDAFCIYLLSTQIDIEAYTCNSSKTALQNHYNEAYKCYKEIILFIKNNKI